MKIVNAGVLAFATFMAAGTICAAEDWSLSDADRDAFREEVRAYILDHPEVILEALQILEERRDAANVEAASERIEVAADLIFADTHSWVGGNPDGDVTLVEFLDYRCGFCRRAYGEIESLVESDGNIRYVVKEFPILGEDSLNSAFFAIALLFLEGNDTYKAAHDFLISYNGSVDDIFVTEYARTHGLDARAILEGMSGERVRRAVADNHELASFLGINGTPGFIVGDQLFHGWVGREEIQNAVAQARSQE